MAESQLLNEEQISKEKIQQVNPTGHAFVSCVSPLLGLLKIFGPLKEQVEASIKQQDHVMAEVQVSFRKIEKKKTENCFGLN